MTKTVHWMVAAGCFVTLVVAMAACQTAEPTATADAGGAADPTAEQPDLTHVITYDTHYYMDGPQQARPPEGMFKAGTKVQLLRDAGSYSLVCAANGTTAYVTTDALRALD
jgi:hypothetical protein